MPKRKSAAKIILTLLLILPAIRDPWPGVSHDHPIYRWSLTRDLAEVIPSPEPPPQGK